MVQVWKLVAKWPPSGAFPSPLGEGGKKMTAYQYIIIPTDRQTFFEGIEPFGQTDRYLAFGKDIEPL